MFDGEALGLEVVSATKAHVDKAVAPLLERIAELERREAHYHELELATTQSLVNIEVGYKNAIAALPPPEPKEFDPEPVRAIAQEIIDARLAAFPVPENGKDGASGEDGLSIKGDPGEPGEPGKDGRDGKDGLDAVEFLRGPDGNLLVSMSNGTVRDLGQFVGKDGTPGRDGKDADVAEIERAAYLMAFAPDDIGERIAMAVKFMAETPDIKIIIPPMVRESAPAPQAFNVHLPEVKLPDVHVAMPAMPDVHIASPVVNVTVPEPKKRNTETTVTEHDAKGRIKAFTQTEID